MYLITLLKMEATKIIVVLKQEDVELILFFQNADACSFWAPALIFWGLVCDTNKFTCKVQGRIFFLLFSFIFLSTQQHFSLWHSNVLQKSHCQEC